MEISKNTLRKYSRLSLKKIREEEGVFIVEGEKSVFDMIDAFEPVDLLVTHEWLDLNQHKLKGFKYNAISQREIKELSSLSTPAQVLAVFKLPKENNYKEIDFRKELVVALDGVQDPGNVGTIIRTADWFGIKNIILSKDCADIYNPKTIQATMGSLRRVKVYREELKEVLNSIPDNTTVIGTVLDGDNVYEIDLPKTGIVIFGSEGRGISNEMKKKVTIPVVIPPVNKFEHPDSLNVGVSCGIMLSLILK